MNDELWKTFFLWALVILWMALIFYVSSIPDLEPGFRSEGANTLVSKVAHIIEYAILTILLARALRSFLPSLSFQTILQIAFLIAYFYAASDEYHQLFVLGREGTFRDVMIDTIGITIIPLYFSKRKRGH